MILEDTLLPYLIRGLLYRITNNMRYVFVTNGIKENICINVVFENEPSSSDKELLVDITGELDGDLHFRNTQYNYIVSDNDHISKILKSDEDIFLIFAKNEDYKSLKFN